MKESDYDDALNYKNHTAGKLLLAIFFSLLSVVVWESVAFGDLLNAPRGLANVVEEPADRHGRLSSERYAEDGTETFSARLMNGSDELNITHYSVAGNAVCDGLTERIITEELLKLVSSHLLKRPEEQARYGIG